ncbi:MAG: AAA family ATPase, partial [Planctomycetes bacterium]|nr:AAA family ATPase [Planctomycetota bacterium]
MKILAIRGKNLASLDGDFEVRLDRSPLADVGLFAITGPTGAGKSTLLDALCLALFDQAPRFDAAGKTRIAGVVGQSLVADDKRNAVRRGATEARAEVEFVGRDGRRYRACWVVTDVGQRTNKGHLKGASLEVHDLETGQPLTGVSNNTEIKAALVRLLGLTYGQFRRSALLAQGDFAAFLSATADERASLLEAMTGTEIYGELSLAAHERAGAERKRADALEAQRAAIPCLPPEARDQLTAEAARQEQAARDAQAAAEIADKAFAWHVALSGLANEERQAAAEHAAAASERAAAAASEQELSAVEAVQDLRGAVDDADRTAATFAAAEKLRGERQQEGARAEATAASAAAGRRTAEEELGAALDRRRSAAADLKAAADLDTRCATLGEALQAAETAERAAMHDQRAATAKVTDLAGKVNTADAAEAAARDWLAAHAALEPLAREWPRWQAAIGAATKALAAATGLTQRRPGAERAVAQAEQELARARAAAESARAGAAAADSAAATAEEAERGA